MSRLFERYMEHLARGAGTEREEFSSADVTECIAVLLKQMVLADGIEREEELAAAEAILRKHYGGVIKDADGGTMDETISVLDTTRNESVFPVCRILLASLEAAEIARLREQLVDIAMADGQFHPYESDLLELFDQLTRPQKGAGADDRKDCNGEAGPHGS